ncbi:MAG: cytochrome P450 [Planctomycetaceae bacterium]|jgi:enediyne biosynthesis protein E7|nr:cytochrome P450 [Planctomycetaceae bacterium]MBT6486389.1 cytochrome P450 [Planctomycetaceae bacterium]MBT6495550.1 cytochrome P450 [Planctomycetaceae bacterium]
MELPRLTAPEMNAQATRVKAPGPRGDFLLGCLSHFQRDAIGLLSRSAQEYGDVVRFRMGPVVAHLVNHPQHVEHVLLHGAENYDKQTRSVSKIRATCGDSLLTSDGEMWRRHRQLIQPAFRQETLERFVPVITETTNAMLKNWQNVARGRAEINIVSEMMQLTLKIAAQILFGADIQDEAEVIERSLAIILRDTWRRLETLFDTSVVSPAFHRRRFRRALQEIDSVVYRIIENRRQSGSSSDDLLSMLLDAHEADSATRLSDRELRDAVITLLLAGHETTANALAWTFYLVSQSPDVEELLRRDALGFESDQTSSADLHYTGMVFSEAIRLYPSVWIIERRAVADDEIGGYHIPAGSTVLVSPYLLHRHPEFWGNPDEFDPERFTPDQCVMRPRNAYIPFGVGPHQCIGKNMASLVAKHVLGMVYRQFRPRLVPGQTIKAEPQITLRHAGGLRMTLHVNQ